MERIQPLSNYLPVKRNLKYPAFLFVAILFFISNYSCIEQFTPNINKGELQNLLVVEGQITDEEGPFRVKLSSTFEIDNMQVYSPPVYGAEVNIFDDKGNQNELFYTVEGWYETEDKKLKGIVGNTYTLNITLEDGTQYESSPVLMPDVPEIDSVYFQEEVRFYFDDFGYKNDEKWLNIYVDSKDPTGETKYWKWDFVETWEVKTPKDSVIISVKPEEGPAYIIIANVEFRDGNIYTGWDNNKEKCWVTVPSTNILIESTEKSKVDEIVKFPINSIAPKNDRLHIKYSILVKQTALSKDMYNFWEKLRESNEESGSIYDKVPSQIFGNIQCCDGKQKALGYFTASAIQTKRIFINPVEHRVKTKDAYEGCQFRFFDPRIKNYYLGDIVAVSNKKYAYDIGRKIYTDEPWCPDCRMYGWNEKPDFWED